MLRPPRRANAMIRVQAEMRSSPVPFTQIVASSAKRGPAKSRARSRVERNDSPRCCIATRNFRLARSLANWPPVGPRTIMAPEAKMDTNSLRRNMTRLLTITARWLLGRAPASLVGDTPRSKNALCPAHSNVDDLCLRRSQGQPPSKQRREGRNREDTYQYEYVGRAQRLLSLILPADV